MTLKICSVQLVWFASFNESVVIALQRVAHCQHSGRMTLITTYPQTKLSQEAINPVIGNCELTIVYIVIQHTV